MRRAFISLGMALILAGCSAGSANGSYVRGTPAAGTSAQPSQTAPTQGFRSPQVMRGVGVDSVIGAGVRDLTNRFGEARIDLTEGDARKLQFISDRCVLDIFLYPLEANTAPVATHVEARVREGGAATDRAMCIAEVEGATDGG